MVVSKHCCINYTSYQTHAPTCLTYDAPAPFSAFFKCETPAKGKEKINTFH